MFPTSRLKDVLGLTGVTYNETRVSEVRFALDPHDRGLIDAHALATFLVKVRSSILFINTNLVP